MIVTAIGSRTVSPEEGPWTSKRHGRVQGSRDHNDPKKQSHWKGGDQKKWKEVSYGQRKGMSESGDLGGELCPGVIVSEIWPHSRRFVQVEWTRAWG